MFIKLKANGKMLMFARAFAHPHIYMQLTNKRTFFNILTKIIIFTHKQG